MIDKKKFLHLSKKIMAPVVNFLFPYRCILCQHQSSQSIDLCKDCEILLPELHNPCDICGLTRESLVSDCLDCLKEKLSFDKMFVGFEYAMPIDFLITQFKFHQKILYGRVLAQLLAKKIISFKNKNTQFILPECLIPVPLHITRLKERGFNQAQEIATTLGHELNIPSLLNVCHRIRATEPQTTLKSTQRKKNIQGAFQMIWSQQVPSRVVIVDDVITTMSTVSELAKTIKQSGVLHVDVWSLARKLQ